MADAHEPVSCGVPARTPTFGFDRNEYVVALCRVLASGPLQDVSSLVKEAAPDIEKYRKIAAEQADNTAA